MQFGRAGDYLYSVFVPTQARDGAWGIFRVGDAQPAADDAGIAALSGANSHRVINPRSNSRMALNVSPDSHCPS